MGRFRGAALGAPLGAGVTKAAKDRQVDVLPVEKFRSWKDGECAAPWTGASSS